MDMISIPVWATRGYQRLTLLSIEEVFQAIRENRVFTFNNRPCSPLKDRIRAFMEFGTDCVCDGCTAKAAWEAGIEKGAFLLNESKKETSS